MSRLLILAQDKEKATALQSELVRRGFACAVATAEDDPATRQAPDLLLLELNGHISDAAALELADKFRQEETLPVLALVNKERLESNSYELQGIDDFIVAPCDISELTLRVKRLLTKSPDNEERETIRCGDLLIDLGECEVSVCGKSAELTFKEYELLRFLASNPGHVFSREALLNNVWSHDYYGGDRTVDVHVRRLRSKIEDETHTFIETVRNIGYRFRKDI